MEEEKKEEIQGKSDTQEEKISESKEKETPILIKKGSVDLMPVLSEKEQKSVEQKHSFDFKSVVFILIVVIASVGFVIYTNMIKNQLDQENAVLSDLRKELELEADIIYDNNQVLNRYLLYNYLQSNFFSSKEVLVFWRDVSEGLCEIDSIELSYRGSLIGYEIRGRSDSLMNVAKFWHFLSIDSRVSKVVLEGVSLPVVVMDSEEEEGFEDSIGFGASFSFSGNLDIKYFDQ